MPLLALPAAQCVRVQIGRVQEGGVWSEVVRDAVGAENRLSDLD
jgi:hypothetical protein